MKSMGPSFLGTFALVFVAIGALWVIDTFLARMEQSESTAQAARLFREGEDLARAGHNNESITRLRGALAISPDSQDYQLTLARVLIAADKLPDADAVLAGVLQRDSTDGEANLLMATALTKQGKLDNAKSYYHMAIYGHWATDAAANRVKARSELIDILVKENAKKELLSELLPLQDELPSNLATRKRLGQLFLMAGSPNRAADTFRQILRDDRHDPDAYAGLGEAEFANRNYRNAQIYLQIAARLKPSDLKLRAQLDLCEQVLALDPMQRGLNTAERLRRSTKLVAMARQAAAECGGTPDVVNTNAEKDAVEANLNLAERLWQARKRSCNQPPAPAEEALELVLARISQ
ncbi:MAG TPA: tetratricopeptide repeat protein [Bryobacteraceae bacterium]|nr:tetratricopeptide repeat protein [Bryobacteraceae bacterium]